MNQKGQTHFRLLSLLFFSAAKNHFSEKYTLHYKCELYRMDRISMKTISAIVFMKVRLWKRKSFFVINFSQIPRLQ